MSESSKAANTAAKIAGAGIAGSAIALAAKGAVPPIHPAYGKGGLPFAVANGTAAATNVLKHHGTLRAALRVGATAAVGGPAVVATAVAAAPVLLAVAGVAAGAAAVYGLYRLLSEK